MINFRVSRLQRRRGRRIALAVGAIAASLIAGSAGARADIVYTDTFRPIPASVSFGGAVQFTTPNAVIGSVSGVGLLGAGSNLVYSDGSSPYVMKLALGTLVGPSLFATGGGVTEALLPFPASPYYVGLDVNSGPGVDNYGYLEFSKAGGLKGVLITAFETVANTPIAVGAMPVPEPGPAALLAIGAVGVLAFRRRAVRVRG